MIVSKKFFFRCRAVSLLRMYIESPGLISSAEWYNSCESLLKHFERAICAKILCMRHFQLPFKKPAALCRLHVRRVSTGCELYMRYTGMGLRTACRWYIGSTWYVYWELRCHRNQRVVSRSQNRMSLRNGCTYEANLSPGVKILSMGCKFLAANRRCLSLGFGILWTTKSAESPVQIVSWKPLSFWT